MKQFPILSVCVALALCYSTALAQVSKEVELPSPVYSDAVVMQPALYSQDGARPLESGSKFITSYSDNCPEELRGAFEYAVKIWEENLPECLPISISVSCKDLPANTPSSVRFKTLSFNQSYNADYMYPTSAVKSVLLREYNRNLFQRFYQELPDVTVLQRPDDISITYNSKMFEDFSFSLDESDVNSRFDFVSLALRDIARGLGIAPLFFVDPDGMTLEKEDEPSTPYTEKLYYELGSDPSTAYRRATSGQFRSSYNFYNFIYYAPSTWIDGLSMETFIPEESKPLTRLLSHEFGRGSVMRKLAGQHWTETFKDLLDWRNDIITGPAQGSITQSGSTDNIIPFDGTITIGANTYGADNMTLTSATMGNPLQFTSSYKISTRQSLEPYGPGYCFPYSFWISGLKNKATTIAALLKDGTWDILYSNYIDSEPEITDEEGIVNPQTPLVVSTDELTHHHDIESYARSVSGGLRYRITTGNKYFDNLRGKEYENYNVTYFTREYTPQAARIKYSGYYTPLENVDAPKTIRRAYRANSDMMEYDDDFIDVPVGISNVEGTDYILVEQYDPGEKYPFSYDEYDFRKGYFMANVLREGTTRLTVISYNKNGSTRSNTIEISNVGTPDRQLSMQREGNVLKFSGISNTHDSRGLLCNLIEACSGSTVMTHRIHAEDSVSLENLEKGMYLVNLIDSKGETSTFKVIK